MKKTIIITCMLAGSIVLMNGCTNGFATLSKMIATMNPSAGDGRYGYSEDIGITVAGTAGNVAVTWSNTTGSRSKFWVVRANDYYLNDYTAVSGELGEAARSFTDTTASSGNVYVYRVLWEHEESRQVYDANSKTYRIEFYTVYEMSRAVMISL